MATQNIKFAGEAAINALASEINKKLTKVSSMPESPDLNMTVLYVGATTSSYTQGGIYQWDGTQWNLLSGGGGGAPVWGNITGTLSNQTDLQNALNNIDYIIGTMGAKNILQMPSSSKTENGVTWTIDSGKIGVSGTPTDYSSITFPTIYNIDNKKYILTGIKDTENILWGKITLRNKNFSILNEWTDITDDVFELDLTSYTNVGSLTIIAGTAENDVAVSGNICPMVCHSEFIDDTTYAKYAKTNVELTDEIQYKQDLLYFDEQPRLNSTNPVTSNGIKIAINENNDTISNSFETELKDTVGWIVKNQLDILLDEIKTLNVNGTWNENVYTYNGITFTFTEINGYVSGITASGISTSSIILYLSNRPAPYYRTWSGKILSGVKNTSSINSLYRQQLYKQFTNPPYANQYYDDVTVKNLSSLSDDAIVYHSLNIDNNVDLTTPVTFNLMLRDPSIIDNSFEPYHDESVKQTLRNAEVIKGKNLFSIIDSIVTPQTETLYSKTTTGYRVYNTTTNTYRHIKVFLDLPQNTDLILTTSMSVTSGTGMVVMEYSDDNTNWINGNWTGNPDASSTNKDYVLNGNTGTHPYWRLVLFSTRGTSGVGDITYSDIMFRFAFETDSTYEPYYIPLKDSKFDRAEQRALGAKNLLAYPYRDTTVTRRGITFTDNLDGSITISGTNDGTGDSNFNFFNQSDDWFNNLANIPLMLSGGISNNLRLLAWSSNTSSLIDNGSGKAITFNSTFLSSSSYNISIQVPNGAPAFSTPVTVYPMVRLASDPDNTYVPYAMTNKELTDAIKQQGGHTMKPNPSTATEANVVNEVNSAASNNDEVTSLFGIQRWSNVKTIRLMITSGIGHNGIGEWQWVFPTTPTKTQETNTWGWFYHESIKKLGDLTKLGYDYELSFKFDSGNHEIITYGGHQVDTDTGCICIRFANYVIDPSSAKIAVDINIVRNDIAV